MELIDKTAVIAKIDNLIGNLRYTVDDEAVQIDILSEVEKFINTLEVKEVDLDALGVLAEHLIACDAHGITPIYKGRELASLKDWRTIKHRKENKNGLQRKI